MDVAMAVKNVILVTLVILVAHFIVKQHARAPPPPRRVSWGDAPSHPVTSSPMDVVSIAYRPPPGETVENDNDNETKKIVDARRDDVLDYVFGASQHSSPHSPPTMMDDPMKSPPFSTQATPTAQESAGRQPSSSINADLMVAEAGRRAGDDQDRLGCVILKTYNNESAMCGGRILIDGDHASFEGFDDTMPHYQTV